MFLICLDIFNEISGDKIKKVDPKQTIITRNNQSVFRTYIRTLEIE